MADYEWKSVDFDHPSFLFVLEDILKGFIGGPVLYNSYFRTFGLKGGEKVLDFGCGGGAGSRCLLKILGDEGHLTCVDISRFWITRAKRRLKNYSNVQCLVGDIRKLDVPDDSFDCIPRHVIRKYIHSLEYQVPPVSFMHSTRCYHHEIRGHGTKMCHIFHPAY